MDKQYQFSDREWADIQALKEIKPDLFEEFDGEFKDSSLTYNVRPFTDGCTVTVCGDLGDDEDFLVSLLQELGIDVEEYFTKHPDSDEVMARICSSGVSFSISRAVRIGNLERHDVETGLSDVTNFVAELLEKSWQSALTYVRYEGLMASNSKFMDLCTQGKASEKDIFDFVDWWHNGTSTKGLPDFLGMSSLEYETWIRHPEKLAKIIAERITKTEAIL